MIVATDLTFEVADSLGRRLGDFTANERQGDLIVGSFARSEQYSTVEPIFAALENVVENQVLSLVDAKRAPIEALGIRLVSHQSSQQWPVFDVQIWSDGSATVRLREPAEFPDIAPPSVNGKAGAK